MAIEKKPTPKRTSMQDRISLLVLWLQRCAQTFPMYGKTLLDFPDRFNAFRDALADLSDADINAGFELAMRHCREFPLPVDIRSFAEQATKQNQQVLAEESRRNQRLIEDRVKDSRFEEADMEARRKEFAEMLASSAQKLRMTAQPQRPTPDARFADRVVPAHIAAAKGPEWESRLREQADEMKRKAESPSENKDNS